jgi:hypothetical protein
VLADQNDYKHHSITTALMFLIVKLVVIVALLGSACRHASFKLVVFVIAFLPLYAGSSFILCKAEPREGSGLEVLVLRSSLIFEATRP